LRPNDQFTIISFDHRQEFFRPLLVSATPDNIAAATSWIRSLQPERGGTDIQVYYIHVLAAINAYVQQLLVDVVIEQ
jgi:hypothetical protein